MIPRSRKIRKFLKPPQNQPAKSSIFLRVIFSRVCTNFSNIIVTIGYQGSGSKIQRCRSTTTCFDRSNSTACVTILLLSTECRAKWNQEHNRVIYVCIVYPTYRRNERDRESEREITDKVYFSSQLTCIFWQRIEDNYCEDKIRLRPKIKGACTVSETDSRDIFIFS